MNKIKNNLNENIKELKIEKDNIKSDTKIEDIKIGMKVYIGSINQEGIVLNLPNKSKKVRVQIGMAKTDFHINDIFIKNNSVKKEEIKTTNTIITESLGPVKKNKNCSI